LELGRAQADEIHKYTLLLGFSGSISRFRIFGSEFAGLRTPGGLREMRREVERRVQ